MSAVLHENILTLADLLDRLGDVSPNRIRFQPAPGTASEDDLIEVRDRENGLFELVEGVLVEKPMGIKESRIAIVIATELEMWMRQSRLGFVIGADGPIRLRMGLVRLPDVSVILREQLPGGRFPAGAISSVSPALAVEVLSASNTSAEIERKLNEYFSAGSRCAWIVDPDDEAVRVYSSPTDFTILRGDQSVTAEEVVPGFSVTVADIFERAGF